MTSETPDLLSLPWRIGRHQGRTIYAQGGPEASCEDDVLIGVMDSPELAAEVCAAHNERLRDAISDDKGSRVSLTIYERPASERALTAGWPPRTRRG